MLVIALVMSGAFRITDTNVGVPRATALHRPSSIDPEDTTLSEAVAAKGAALGGVHHRAGREPRTPGGVGSWRDLGRRRQHPHQLSRRSRARRRWWSAPMTATALRGGGRRHGRVERPRGHSRSRMPMGATLTPIEVGDSDGIAVGEWVMAIGSPFGNEQSVSTGIVSALYRSTALPSTGGTSIYANMIQTDAAINPVTPAARW
ncbi:MAG: S1C family serine protease [Collinsella sp.]